MFYVYRRFEKLVSTDIATLTPRRPQAHPPPMLTHIIILHVTKRQKVKTKINSNLDPNCTRNYCQRAWMTSG